MHKRLCYFILTPNVRLAEGAVSSKVKTPNSSGLTCSPTPNASQAEETVLSHSDTRCMSSNILQEGLKGFKSFDTLSTWNLELV